MSRLLKAVLMSAGAILIAFSSSGGRAQPASERAVEQYSCKDVMREAGADRDVAVAFLHGFLLGKSGSSKFDLITLSKQTDDFFERCLSNPNEKAVDVMMNIKK